MMLAFSGDFQAVTELVAEEAVLAEVTGVQLASFAGLLVAAYRGRPREAATLLAETSDDSRASGHWVAWATAILNNGLGRYPEAYEAAELAATSRDGPFTPTWALPELIEAAVRSGQRARAEEALEQLYAADCGRLRLGAWSARPSARVAEHRRQPPNRTSRRR